MDPDPKPSLVKSFNFSSSNNKIFITILLFALLAGVGTGYSLASSNNSSRLGSQISLNETPKTPQQDNKTFRDFAEGKITKKPEPKMGEGYSEGTHFLIREAAVPVALTSSVVDLSQYESKFVKVFGETQKAIKEGWLMDVGKIEEKK